jgi:hypothetical protein
MYLGLLFPVEGYRIYASHTNTLLKIIVVCDSSAPEFSNMKEFFHSLIQILILATQNPFQELGKPLKSRKLEGILANFINKQILNSKR